MTDRDTSHPAIVSAVVSLADLGRRVDSEAMYVILDGCGQRDVTETVRALPATTSRCLYRGVAEARFWDIAPYLLKLDAALWQWVSTELTAEPFGILIESPANLEGLRRHLRRFLMVASPGGEPWYFRYYDPRLIARFLSAISAEEASVFFGPITAFATLTAEGTVTRLTLRDGASATPTESTSQRFVIRQQVLNAMNARRQREFLDRLENHLREHLDAFAHRHLPSALDQQISAGIAQARRFDLEREIDVARFVTVVCRDLGGFRQTPIPVPGQNQLLDRRHDVGQRLDRFESWAAKWRKRAEGIVG